MKDLTAFRKMVGRNIRRARRNIYMTQADLSIGSGLHITAISAFESGRRCPGLFNLLKIADVTKEPLTFFVTEFRE